jgi:hypothetical protein
MVYYAVCSFTRFFITGRENANVKENWLVGWRVARN